MTHRDVVTQVATANVKAQTIGLKGAEAIVRDLIDAGADLVGLQEWGASRAPVLNALDRDDWGHAGQRRPVLFDRARYDLLQTFIVTLVPAGRVNAVPGKRGKAGAVVVRVARLYDRKLAAGVTVLNYHLPAASSKRGHPRRTLRGRRHADAALALSMLWRDERRRPGVAQVFALGDSNQDARAALAEKHPRSLNRRMSQAGATTCWLGNMPETGTHGHRVIDEVYTHQPALRVRQLRNASDHDAVLATYRRSL